MVRKGALKGELNVVGNRKDNLSTEGRRYRIRNVREYRVSVTWNLVLYGSISSLLNYAYG